MKPPPVLLLGGLEPSGRAGLFADVATAHALGARAFGIATLLTAQGNKTFASDAVDTKVVAAQLRAVMELGPVAAAKVGAVPDAAMLGVIMETLRRWRIPVLLDPVVRTSLGQRLSALGADDYLRWAGPNVVLTPNSAEAMWLLAKRRLPSTLDEASGAGLALVAAGFGAVVVKGVRIGARSVDMVCSARRVVGLMGTWLPYRADKRGTGCRFASALCVRRAMGDEVTAAAAAAKAHVRAYLDEVNEPLTRRTRRRPPRGAFGRRGSPRARGPR